jgi:hypothetical protein
MRSVLAGFPLAALLLAGSLYGQQSAALSACGGRNGLTVGQLQELTHQYHPDALAPGAQRDTIIVGFVLDTACNVVRHAIGHYQPDTNGTLDAELIRLFPDLNVSDLRSVGGWTREPFAPGHLLVAWAVLKRT